jgi:benzoyl-CoA reductase/2-hydroxyglutaryl-CoA dehydratase subunit BcrC/BadD/HgdB
VLLHSDKSCKPYSLGQIDQRDRISCELGVPALLQADHDEARVYSEERGRTRMEALIEMSVAA